MLVKEIVLIEPQRVTAGIAWNSPLTIMSVAILHAASESGMTLDSSERPRVTGFERRRRVRGRLTSGTTGTTPMPCVSRSVSVQAAPPSCEVNQIVSLGRYNVACVAT